jgi:hypothetical protein
VEAFGIEGANCERVLEEFVGKNPNFGIRNLMSRQVVVANFNYREAFG